MINRPPETRSPVHVIAANPSLDRLMEVDSVEKGRIHRARLLAAVPGGKPLNVARTLHSLGTGVRVIGVFGGRMGELLRQEVEALGIEVDAIMCDHESRTSVSVHSRLEGGLTEFYEIGSEVPDSLHLEIESQVNETVLPGSWLVMAGSSPRAIDQSELARIAGEQGVKVAIDLEGIELSQSLDHRVSLIKINAEEASGLLSREIAGTEQVGQACIDIQATAAAGSGVAPTVIVTRGADGAIAVDEIGKVWGVGVPAVGDYPVGSGDSFLGGMLAMLAKGKPLDQALEQGAAVAIANAHTPGPACFELDDVDAYREMVELVAI